MLISSGRGAVTFFLLLAPVGFFSFPFSLPFLPLGDGPPTISSSDESANASSSSPDAESVS